jgi:predicted Zn-dependent peptidase
MKIHTKTFKNKLRVQAIEMPGTNVITTIILVGAGSRYETKEISGISHFLEHMFFKGAKKYKTPKAVSEAIDKFGGEFNAFTGKEYAGYYIKSGKENFEKSVDVLADMLGHSTFPKEELEKERGVILEEMAMYLDAPMYQISWDFERLVFGDQPLGWDQIGTRELINNLTQEQLLAYKQALYVPENMVITVAGAVSKKSLDLLEQYFKLEDKPQKISPTKFDDTKTTKKFQLRTKKTEQFHIAFGVKAISEISPDYPVLKVLATILGGNMSARMFQNIREEKGLCYSIRTSVDEFSDTGLLVTRAGVKVDEVLKAVEAIRVEYDKIAQEGITAEELENAQNYMIGKTDLGTEDTEDVAHEYAKNELMYQKIESFDNWKNKIRNVTKEQVEDLARKLLKPENFRFAGIGPEIDEDELMKFIS